MLEALNRNPAAAVLAAAALALVVLAVAVLLLARQSRRARRDRERMLGLLRRESESQGQSMERLNRAVNDSLRQVAELSGVLDARMEAFTRQSDANLGEMRRMVG